MWITRGTRCASEDHLVSRQMQRSPGTGDTVTNGHQRLNDFLIITCSQVCPYYHHCMHYWKLKNHNHYDLRNTSPKLHYIPSVHIVPANFSYYHSHFAETPCFICNWFPFWMVGNAWALVEVCYGFDESGWSPWRSESASDENWFYDIVLRMSIHWITLYYFELNYWFVQIKAHLFRSRMYWPCPKRTFVPATCSIIYYTWPNYVKKIAMSAIFQRYSNFGWGLCDTDGYS